MSNNIRRLGTALIGCAIAVVVGMPAVAKAQAPQNNTGPRLDFPGGLATDGQAVYVANSRNNTVDRIDLTSHTIALLAGTLFKEGSTDGTGASAMFSSPSGVGLAGDALYVSDTNNSMIRKISLPGGVVTTAAGAPNIAGTDDGRGQAAHFNLPTQIAVDPTGNRLFLTDTDNSTVRMIQLPDMIVKTIARTGADRRQGRWAAEQVRIQSPARNRH